jgi:hypothetical protein
MRSMAEDANPGFRGRFDIVLSSTSADGEIVRGSENVSALQTRLSEGA